MESFDNIIDALLDKHAPYQSATKKYIFQEENLDNFCMRKLYTNQQHEKCCNKTNQNENEAYQQKRVVTLLPLLQNAKDSYYKNYFKQNKKSL